MFSVGNLVKINPSIIPESGKPDELFGELGVPGLFRWAIFEITDTQVDETRGNIILCKIANPGVFKSVVPGVKEVKYEGELVLLQSEVVRASMKIDLEYVIKTEMTKSEYLSKLFAERQEFKASGLDKRHKPMRDNWKLIQIARGEISGPAPVLGKTSVYLPKQKMTFEISQDDLPSSDAESIEKFKYKLSSMLSQSRRSRRGVEVEKKEVFGCTTVEKLGGVYLKPNSLLEAYNLMMRTTLETDKKPMDSKATYVGVEIEFIYSGKYDALKSLLVENKLHRNVCLKEDGSLRACHNTGYQVKELTLIAKTEEIKSVLERLNKVFLNPKVDAYANRSCGLHVHLDVRNRDAKLVYKNLVRVQDILRGSQPIGRLTNTYCKTNTSDELDSYILNGETNGERYLVINGNSFVKHKSIEVRVHEGTVDCDAIYNWVCFVNAIASHKTEIPKNDSRLSQDLASKFNIEIPVNAIDYLDRRIEKFNSLTVTA